MLPRFVLLAPLALCSSLLLYVAVAFDGTRVDQANDAAIAATVAINLLGYVAAFLLRSWRLALINGAALVIFVFASIEASLSCFCIGGGCEQRLGNCEAAPAPAIGLLNAVLIVLFDLRLAFGFVVATALAFPLLVGKLRGDQVEPLLAAVSTLDLQADCLVRAPVHGRYPTRLDGAARVLRLQDLQPGRLGGETLPRYYLVTNGEARVWIFRAREFAPVQHQDLDLGDLCKDATARGA
ncbi:hypothetical protein [Ostreiculturibacter nitratireducens]|uniref:hypothetical protein n=1 Tax=Ostreiculturibacter nitratireducens TaxID=3075226 RepID=UPI0031B59C19